MAIIITNQDCNLSDADAFWTVVASNMSCFPSATFHLTLSSARYISFTPSNTGDFQGVVLSLFNYSGLTDRNVNVELQQSYSGTTITQASPAVCNTAGMDFTEGQQVQFTTTGALPTGLTVNTIYYVRNPNLGTGDYNVSTTPSGSLINTTVAGSGTHTAHVLRATKTKTANEIYTYAATSFQRYGHYFVDFRGFDASPTLTTTSNGWRFRITYSGGTGGYWSAWLGNDNTNLFFAAYSNTLATFADNDTPIFANYCEIDQSATFGSVLGTGDTVHGVAGIVCANLTDITPDNISYLTCLTPAASYTLTLKGLLVYASHSGIRIGTALSPIPASEQFIIDFNTPTVGTKHGAINNPAYQAASANYTSKESLFFYFEYPVIIRTYLTEDTQRGKSSITLNDDMSSLWSVAEEVFVGKQDVIGAGDTTIYPITSFGKKDVTPVMTSNILPAPYIVSASGEYSATYAAWKAFNGTFTAAADAWLVSSTTTSWLKVDLNTLSTVIKYRLYNALDATAKARAPKDWTFEGSNDDSSWDVLDTQTGITNWDNFNHYTIATPASYRYYRLNITANNGDATYTNMLDFKIFEAADNKTIELSKNILTYNRLNGASVLCTSASKYGISLKATTAAGGVIRIQSCNNFNIEGVHSTGVVCTSAYVSAYPYSDDASTYLQKMTFKNCLIYNDGVIAVTYFLNILRISKIGMGIENVYGIRATPIYTGMLSYKLGNYVSGVTTINNFRIVSQTAYCFGWANKGILNVSNLYVENAGSYGMVWNPVGKSTLTNAYLWGITGSTGSFIGAMTISTASIGSTITNLYIDKSSHGLVLQTTAILLDTKFINANFGTLSPNTNDYWINDGALFDFIVRDSTGFTTFYHTDLTNMTEGSIIRFINHGDISYNDKTESVYGFTQRTGGTLADTTSHTIGADKYAIRFQNNLYGNPLEWKMNIPTGNVSGLTLIIGVWVNINSANYYSVNYNKPRLTINYDDGASSTYVEALNQTGWQYISLAVTPATSSGQLEVVLSTDTDQSGSDAYVYFDDMSVFYPPGVQLSLGGLDLWANAEPITPPISTSINANDIWAVALPGSFIAGQAGKILDVIDKTTKGNQGLILSK